MSIILTQPDLFAPERWPHKPYCTDDLESGLRVRSYQHAIKRRYIQANPPHMRVWSLYDIDRPGGGLAWEDANLPMPSWTTVNKSNGHAHIAYGLVAPVLTASMEARQAPLRYLEAVEACFRAKLGGDDGYTGLITKNPQHPHWWTLKGKTEGFELGYLAEFIDLERFKPRQGVKVAEVGLGRNVTLFDFVRLWAYKEVRNHENFESWEAAIYTRCLYRNADFPVPMNFSEVRCISKSVAKWVWKRFGGSKGFAQYVAATHTSEIQSRRRKMGSGRPALGDKIYAL
jgi:Replicase family/Primase C terminal 1 (PriCT-1)